MGNSGKQELVAAHKANK